MRIYFHEEIIKKNIYIFEVQGQKPYPLTCAPSEESDQIAHSHSLIKTFTGHILDSQE